MSKSDFSVIKGGVVLPKNEGLFHPGILTASRITRLELRKFF